jgi:hypothetical protein
MISLACFASWRENLPFVFFQTECLSFVPFVSFVVQTRLPPRHTTETARVCIITGLDRGTVSVRGPVFTTTEVQT